MLSLSRVRPAGRDRLVRWTLLTAGLLALAACSAVNVAYNNLDLYLLWKADDYFSLDSRQEGQLKAELDSTAAWHRSEELVRYAALFSAAQERVGSEMTEADIEWLLMSARQRYDALARRGAPGAATVLSSLTPGQIAHFEARLRRENDRFAAKYVDPLPDAQRRQRFERTVTLMEDWVGPLSEVQRARVESLCSDMPLTNALRHLDRQRRQESLVSLLKQGRTPESLAPALEAWMIEWDQGRSPEYQALAQETRRRTVAMVLDLHRSLSPAQRSRLQSRIGRYAHEFQSLATSGRPVQAAVIDRGAGQSLETR
jgi:hypothetical protein